MSPPSQQDSAPVVETSGQRPNGHRSVPLVADHQLDHYPEFSTFLAATFGLETDPFGPPGLVSVEGRFYELVFVGYSGRPFPAGIRIAALVPDLEPLDEHQADLDLWALLNWVVRGADGEWNTEALTTTGRIYRTPGAVTGSRAGLS